jgi:hypothetical protein
VEENVPGVVLINAERIEFYQIDGNTLKQITRGTMGTGVNGLLDIGTQVFDQGTDQQFATSEVIDVQIMYTDNGLPFYSIETEDLDVEVPNTTATILSKGITLDPFIPYTDHVDVYLGGVLLSKDPVYRHDTTVQLDNISLDNIKGTIGSIEQLSSITANGGDSYVDQSTGKVWTFTRTRTDNLLYPGWAYSGMTRVAPEFTISVVGLAQYIYLNKDVEDGIELAVVKKHGLIGDFNSVVSTTTSQTLWNSTSSIAVFLKDSPTLLPKKLNKSTDDILKDEQARPLTNEKAEVLTGKI